MRLIMTHEQADLDALASMLGAHILMPDAYAVLPRQINRNGQAFLRKFGKELGFTRSHDLPKKNIKEIILVDTQSMVTLRGITRDTTVRVIDHHARKSREQAEWDYEIHDTGACTTLLVEKIMEAKLPVSPQEATLMLLGIYEDTGSLTYPNTIARDASAVSYLLTMGADLNIASKYLNPPLSNAQMQLYDRLLQNLITVHIEQSMLVVACASALDLNDEISSVAHRLREFLEPDGLIVLALTRMGLRLVARGNSPDVDMAKLAKHFGGGGHQRAASALIRLQSRPVAEQSESILNHYQQKVLDFLPHIVSPSLQVKHIMSQNPLLLSPETTVQEVAELMNRYGFEGYPVVEDGRVIGLLNRRNVDRALHHKLDATTGELMDSGEVSVVPEDSISYLQELMTASGWGQVPVLEKEHGKVIGIVTRTDLLGALHPATNIPSQDEIIAKLEHALPPSRLQFLKTIARHAADFGVSAYIVGGFVRDLMLDLRSQDFDIVIEGDAIAFAKDLVGKFGGRVVSHSRFGTAKWIISEEKEAIAKAIFGDDLFEAELLPEHLDLISARTEFYEKPAALPTVESSSIKMDLHRRDFTINTLALQLDGENFGTLFDFWGGLGDLQDGKIKVLHALSFVDDATRMMRAVRFAMRFGFSIETRTLSLLENSLPLLNEISGARLLHEFNLILQESEAIKMLQMLHDLGILAHIHPALPWNEHIRQRLEQALAQVDAKVNGSHKSTELNERQTLTYCLWLEGLNAEELASLNERMVLPARLMRLIEQTRETRHVLPVLVDAKPSKVVEVLQHMQDEALYAVRLSTQDERETEVLDKYTSHYQYVSQQASGADLRALGLEPSPQYEIILQRLKAAWLDGEIHSPEEEKELLKRLVAE
ncbi:MAG TPA: CBS domain-containing protein [Anaerolineaceae bacterium]|nr:CBS domain-containing protein [Anaerolineaceae bacterium]